MNTTKHIENSETLFKPYNMKKNIKIYEMPLLYLTIGLILFGIVMQYSASSTLAINKFGWNNYLMP